MKKFPCRDTAIIPSLSLIQNHYGYVTENDMEELSRILNLPEARIFSVASFYSMLRLKAAGKYHIQVCTNLSCSLDDRESLFDYISKKLHITEGETTPDGLFSVESVECLGSCGYAPAMLVNSVHYENLDFDKVDKIIESIRKKEYGLVKYIKKRMG